MFPHFDTLYKIAQQFTDPNPNETKKVLNLLQNPQRLQQYDPVYNSELGKDFDMVYKKGKDSGIHWTDIVMARYELEKMMLPRELIGLNKVMPIRLQGYIFVEDMLTRQRYIIYVKDVFTLRDKWYGGHLVNVLEAETIDEYISKLAAEKQMEREKLLAQMYGSIDEEPVADTVKPIKEKSVLAIENEEEEEEEKERSGDVAERKYYTGTFDNETQVELYIRGMKGGCPETVCSWEAMYRFRDMDEYIKLEVTRGADGSWVFNEEPEVGTMELHLNDKKFTGSWMSLKDKTEYVVDLTEKEEVKGKKLMKMDDIMENGLFAN
jgi:hypothetical protein